MVERAVERDLAVLDARAPGALVRVPVAADEIAEHGLAVAGGAHLLAILEARVHGTSVRRASLAALP